jgi:tetratricopeptide (TPR) repeat protein
LGALVTLPRTARAQSPASPPDPRSDAKALYEQGADAYRVGRYARAVELFLAADALSPSAALSYNVARAYDRLGDAGKALRYYRDYVRRAPPSAQASEARSAIATLERRLMQRGVQQVTVRSDPNAELSIDGRPLGSTPWTGELAPGSHRLTLAREGFVATERTFELSPEHALDIDARLQSTAQSALVPASSTADSLVAEAGPRKAHEPADDVSSSSFGPWPWVTLAAGGATLAAAGVFELARRSAENDADRAGDQVAYADALETMHDRQTAARVLLGVGAGLVAVGTTLVVVELGTKPERPQVAVGCSPLGCTGTLQVPLR